MTIYLFDHSLARTTGLVAVQRSSLAHLLSESREQTACGTWSADALRVRRLADPRICQRCVAYWLSRGRSVRLPQSTP